MTLLDDVKAVQKLLSANSRLTDRITARNRNLKGKAGLSEFTVLRFPRSNISLCAGRHPVPERAQAEVLLCYRLNPLSQAQTVGKPIVDIVLDPARERKPAPEVQAVLDALHELRCAMTQGRGNGDMAVLNGKTNLVDELERHIRELALPKLPDWLKGEKGSYQYDGRLSTSQK